MVGLALPLGGACGSVLGTNDGGGGTAGGTSGHGGAAGGKSGSGGTGGTGGVSCGDLATQYADALPAAQSCDVNASGECQQLVSFSLSPCFVNCMTYANDPIGPERDQGELGAGGLQQCCCSLSRHRVPPTDQRHVSGRRWWQRHLLLEQWRWWRLRRARWLSRRSWRRLRRRRRWGRRCGRLGRQRRCRRWSRGHWWPRRKRRRGKCWRWRSHGNPVPIDSSAQWVCLRRAGLLLRGLCRARSHDRPLSPRRNIRGPDNSMHSSSLLPWRRRRPELPCGNDLHTGRGRRGIGQMCVEHLRNRPDRM